MKIVVVGDIHGHNSWKKILETEEAWNKVIFLGDYVDSFTVSSKEQRDNLVELLTLKDGNIIRLVGNHDLNYVPWNRAECSGYSHQTQGYCGQLIIDALMDGKIIPFYQQDNILFSHAGFTRTWLKTVYRAEHIEDISTDYDKFNWATLKFNYNSGYDSHGDTISQGPTWVRPPSLVEDSLDDYIQVVGHTVMPSIAVYREKDIIWCCDTLGYGQYLVIDDGEFLIKKFTL